MREAILYSTTRPTSEQEQRFCAFLKRRYGEEFALVWKQSADYPRGFCLAVGEDLFDWSMDGRLRRFEQAFAGREEEKPLLRQAQQSARAARARTKKETKAVLYSETPPTQEQENRFYAFLAEKYGENVLLRWEKSDEAKGGFRLRVGEEVYDYTAQGRLRQFKDYLQSSLGAQGNIIPLLKTAVGEWTPKALAQEVGTVLSVGDGIAEVSGLAHAAYGEILLFDGGVRGMVQNWSEESVGCILFDDEASVSAGSAVRRTGRTAGVPVGDVFLGRAVNSLGVPIDGLGEIKADGYRPIESPAPGIVERQGVSRPLETGILAIDAMLPIGRGQRELIIGDRQTGKTAIALDTIINQKGKDVICIYVSIGQKASSVMQIMQTLKTRGAMEYSIIVHAGASESAPLQYIAPYAGCALGEYFMAQGKDVLIVYDDLSKHAIAYRAMSLLLGRSPGREAYPGDVFYLHSRLLERAACLSIDRGGGSMTALPIVETQAGDVSAYIPTNIISITDGQIFLESSLFFSGQRPAVNVGLSVSRVGGDAQTKAMKRAAKSMRLDLAQYREMEVFTQFSSDLDETTKRQLVYGQGLMRLLRQKQYAAYAMNEQVVLLTAALHHAMQSIPADEVGEFAAKLLAQMHEKQSALMERIAQTKLLSDEDEKTIIEEAKQLAESRTK